MLLCLCAYLSVVHSSPQLESILWTKGRLEMVEVQSISVSLSSAGSHKGCSESSCPCLLSHLNGAPVQGLSMLGRKEGRCAFKILFPIPFLAQKGSLNLSPRTESWSRMYPTVLRCLTGHCYSNRDLMLNPAFIPPLRGIYLSLPWVKSPSLPHNKSWHWSGSLVHLAPSSPWAAATIPVDFISCVIKPFLS